MQPPIHGEPSQARRRHDVEVLVFPVGLLLVVLTLAIATTLWPAAF